MIKEKYSKGVENGCICLCFRQIHPGRFNEK